MTSEQREQCFSCKQNCFTSFLSSDKLSLVNNNKTDVSYAAGQVICKEGSFNSSILFIKSGLVKIAKEGRHKKNTIVEICKANDFLTIPIQESQHRFNFTALALTDVSICEIKLEAIVHLLKNNHDFQNYLGKKYLKEQMYLIDKLHLISTRNNHGKLSASILYLSSFNTDRFSVFEYISRKDLAELSSISQESVNKILQELNNDKIITVQKGSIKINKKELLQRLSEIG